MREELQRKLIDDFPWLDPRRCDPREPYVRFGAQCGDGWYQLLHDLCQEIADRFAADGVEPNIIVGQIKEKFAGLRFYYEYTDAPCPIAAIDIFGLGTERIHPESGDIDAPRKRRMIDIRQIVNHYERKSLEVCEFCGKAGTRHGRGWINTSCDACWERRLAEQERKYAERVASRDGKEGA